jgi:hypothetical protein
MCIKSPKYPIKWVIIKKEGDEKVSIPLFQAL